MAETGNLDADHHALDDELTARAFFEQVGQIADVLPAALTEMQRDGLFTTIETAVMNGYLQALSTSIRALAMKYLVAGRIDGRCGVT